VEPQRQITARETQLLRDAEFAHTEYLIHLRALAFALHDLGLREVRLAITEAESSGHWLQDCAWHLALLDGPLRADRAWEYRETDS
jgi:hypothetical protein